MVGIVVYQVNSSLQRWHPILEHGFEFLLFHFQFITHLWEGFRPLTLKWEIWMELQASGFGLAQPRPFWLAGE